jgi:hypothetical protein
MVQYLAQLRYMKDAMNMKILTGKKQLGMASSIAPSRCQAECAIKRKILQFPYKQEVTFLDVQFPFLIQFANGEASN